MIGRPPDDLLATLPRVIFGPKAQGRSYDLLFRTDERWLTVKARSVVSDFVLALSGWARPGRSTFYACLPLDEDTGSALLVRAANGQASELGSVAMAYGFVLSRDVLAAIDNAPWRLAPYLPAPTKRSWAEPLAIEPFTPSDFRPEGPSTERLGRYLAHRPLAVTIAQDVNAQAVAATVLEGYHRRSPEGPPIYWCTTGSMPRSGWLDPEKIFRLFVHASGDDAAVQSYRQIGVTQIRQGAALPPSPPLGTFESGWDILFDAQAWYERRKAPRLRDTAIDSALARAARRPQLAEPPAEAVLGAIRRVVEELRALNRDGFEVALEVIARLAYATRSIGDEAMRLEMCRGVSRAFFELLPEDKGEAARAIGEYVERIEPHLMDVYPAALPVAVITKGLLGHLEGEHFESLAQRGIVTQFARQVADWIAVQDIAPASRVAVLLGLAGSALRQGSPGGARDTTALVEAAILYCGRQVRDELDRTALDGAPSRERFHQIDPRAQEQFNEIMPHVLAAMSATLVAGNPDFAVSRGAMIGQRLADFAARGLGALPKSAIADAKLLRSTLAALHGRRFATDAKSVGPATQQVTLNWVLSARHALDQDMSARGGRG